MNHAPARQVWYATLASLTVSASAWAHHSFSAFDMAKEVDVQGVVKEFRWTNPHSFLVLNGKDAAGKPAEVRVEMNGPGYLVRNGWKRESLKPGDAVTVTVHPLRDGTLGGDLVKVVFADGRTLSAAITLNTAPAAGEQR
jgi:hypothetical protein